MLLVRLYFCWPLMRKLVSIFFLSLMLLQAIPVLHFFAEKKEVFYSYVDEEEPEHKSKVEKKAFKEYLPLFFVAGAAGENNRRYRPFSEDQPLSPSLEFLTPPPNAC